MKEQKDLIGKKVKTLSENKNITDWNDDVKYSRKWGVKGTIQRLSNSHGLCYEVKHDDGTISWYDSSELTTEVE